MLASLTLWFNKPIQQCFTWRIQKCHCHVLSRNPTISYTILRSTQHRPLQMEWQIMEESPRGRSYKSRTPALTSLCLICHCTPTQTHWLPTPRMRSHLPRQWRHWRWWPRRYFSLTQLCWWHLILCLPPWPPLSMWTSPLLWCLHWMLCKPSHNQSIDLMKWNLHSTCPNYSQSTLGALNLQFNLTILNNTSSYR